LVRLRKRKGRHRDRGAGTTPTEFMSVNSGELLNSLSSSRLLLGERQWRKNGILGHLRCDVARAHACTRGAIANGVTGL